MNQRLEQYLGEAEQKLHSLPEARRKEELEEIRQHLMTSVEAHEELGMDTATATEESIRQFGAVQQISGGLQKAWWREQVGGPRGLWKTSALAIALRYVVSGLLSPATALATYAATYANRGHATDTFTTVLQVAVIAFCSALPAVVAGVAIGRLSPRNAVPGTAIAMGIYSLITLLDSAVMMAYIPNAHRSVAWWGPAAQLAQLTLGVLFMIAAAWFTVGHERKRVKRTR